MTGDMAKEDAVVPGQIDNRFPMKGGEEVTLVQPEGVPVPNRAVVSRDAGEVIGRASGAHLTGPTSSVLAARQLRARDVVIQAPVSAGLKPDSNGCQGQPILNPRTTATPPRAAHDRPGASDVLDVVCWRWGCDRWARAGSDYCCPECAGGTGQHLDQCDAEQVP